ncbi:MAG: pro-sigmaK processing inhibitor BofA family protein [Peptococcaceae bacterium]|nr:pro-sigmaK processing inhibitor BofA family protein [Peptococcaceae bacterium]
MPQIQMETVLFVFFAVAVIFLIARLALSPAQVMLKLLLNSALAVVVLCFTGLIGEQWGMHLPVNPLTVLLIAILGLPGLLLVSVLYVLLI